LIEALLTGEQSALIESINDQRDLTLVKSNVTGGRCATAPQSFELVGTPCRREIYPTRP
jgi:hypothetical protein